MGSGRLGGCLDRTFRRPPQPWEITDGYAFLLSLINLHVCAIKSNLLGEGPKWISINRHCVLYRSCVYLLSELSLVSEASQKVVSSLPLLAEAANRQHYTHHVVLLETVCKQLPVIAKGIGKRPFKMHLEIFLNAIFYGLVSTLVITGVVHYWIISKKNNLFLMTDMWKCTYSVSSWSVSDSTQPVFGTGNHERKNRTARS